MQIIIGSIRKAKGPEEEKGLQTRFSGRIKMLSAFFVVAS